MLCYPMTAWIVQADHKSPDFKCSYVISEDKHVLFSLSTQAHEEFLDWKPLTEQVSVWNVFSYLKVVNVIQQRSVLSMHLLIPPWLPKKSRLCVQTLVLPPALLESHLSPVFPQTPGDHFHCPSCLSWAHPHCVLCRLLPRHLVAHICRCVHMSLGCPKCLYSRNEVSRAQVVPLWPHVTRERSTCTLSQWTGEFLNGGCRAPKVSGNHCCNS